MNLQNISHKSDYKVRKAFSSSGEEGWKWLRLDYSQLELRVGTHFSKDPEMMKVYMNDGDIHSTTAKGSFNLDCEASEVKAKYPGFRDKAKVVNFGMVKNAEAGEDVIPIKPAQNGGIRNIGQNQLSCGLSRATLKDKRSVSTLLTRCRVSINKPSVLY